MATRLLHVALTSTPMPITHQTNVVEGAFFREMDIGTKGATINLPHANVASVRALPHLKLFRNDGH